MSATLDDLQIRERKLDARDAKLTEREQAFSQQPPIRDLAWEKRLSDRETLIRQREQSLVETEALHDEERKAIKQLRGSAEDLIAQAGATLKDAQARVTASNEQEAALAESRSRLEAERQAFDQAVKDARALAKALADQLDARDRQADEKEREQQAHYEQRTAELHAVEAALEKQRQEQAAITSTQADLQRLLEQERTPEIERREQAVARHEVEVIEAAKTNTAISVALKDAQTKQDTEASRLKGWARGIDEREALIDRREAECTRRETTVGNREAALKAKQG